MYHAHFGLERGLFGEGIAADTAVFRTPKHDRLIAHFKLALASTSSVVVLRGPAGVGKTTLTSTALRMTSTRLALAWLDGTAANAAELLELILVELGVSTLRTTRIERVQLWRQFQAEMRATDSRLFLVVERAEDLSPEVLHALDQLTAPDATGNPGANLVLLGNDGLDAHLAAPILESLRQRIRLRAELEAFTEAELQDYLRHQVACAGGTYDRMFTPGTVAALFRYSRGVARLVNNLCESALDVAAVQKHKQLTAELVAKTAVSLLGLGEAAPAARPAAPAASVPLPPIVGLVPPRSEARPTPQPAEVAAAAPAAPAPALPPAPTLPPAARAAVAPAPAPALTPPPQPVEAAPAQPIVGTAVPSPAAIQAAPAPTAAAQRKPFEAEFDGGATDVTDVAVADFPILTDAVEFPAASPGPTQSAPAAAKPPPPAVPPAAARTPAAAPSVAPTFERTPAILAAGAPKATGRIETAYTAGRSPKPEPATPPPPPDAADDDDLLRQTQTMRAISVAKSIDDISSSMAETLFGDAELDLVAAALASAAADWPEGDDQDAKPLAKPAAEPKAKAAPLPADDPFDLFGLGEDAPLELIDDSMQPPGKSAAR